MRKGVCCFVGHREIDETKELVQKLYSTIENLVLEQNVNTFLFGSKSRFDNLCYEQVSKIKEKHPHIKRIYVRAEFPYIDENYTSYLLKRYESTYYPKRILGAGKAVYIERNFEMIEKSHFCVIYYHNDFLPQTRKSGTKIALDHAIKKHKQIILLP